MGAACGAIEPRPFDPRLIALAEEVVPEPPARCRGCRPARCTTPRRWRASMPAAMLFVRSLGGVSHTSAEDSPTEDVKLGVRALYELTRRAVASARG